MHLVAQEIIAIDSEADVRVGRETVHPVKGELPKPNLGEKTFVTRADWEKQCEFLLSFPFILRLIQQAAPHLLFEQTPPPADSGEASG